MSPFLIQGLMAVISAVPFEKIFAIVVNRWINNPEDKRKAAERVKVMKKVAKAAKVAADLLDPAESPELDPIRKKALESWEAGQPTPEEAKTKLGV